MNYYISDLHFGHANILRHDNRPFANTDEMAKVIVERWNKTVSDQDDVYILGDIFWRNTPDNQALFRQLKGRKHLIRGNHDKGACSRDFAWSSIHDYLVVRDLGRKVILCHYPILFYDGHYHGSVMLYGHVHNSREYAFLLNWESELLSQGIPSQMINVGCMLPYMDYTPRTLDELVKGHGDMLYALASGLGKMVHDDPCPKPRTYDA